jgi:hypothetical protein
MDVSKHPNIRARSISGRMHAQQILLNGGRNYDVLYFQYSARWGSSAWPAASGSAKQISFSSGRRPDQTSLWDLNLPWIFTERCTDHGRNGTSSRASPAVHIGVLLLHRLEPAYLIVCRCRDSRFRPVQTRSDSTQQMFCVTVGVS